MFQTLDRSTEEKPSIGERVLRYGGVLAGMGVILALLYFMIE